MKKILFIVTLIVTLFSCRKSDNFTEPSNPTTPTKRTVSGVVQKGPFIKGTKIKMWELDPSLNQTGRDFETNILSNDGGFSFDSITLSSTYAAFSADGFYFNEFTNTTSSSQLTLQAITNVTSPSININVLTHLERPRVEQLIKSGVSFVDAKKQAQREILNAFNFLQDTLLANSESLNIITNSNDNAILLAISLIIQGDRSVGNFTELLADLQNDLKTSGQFTSRLQDSLRRTVRILNVFNIRQNLVNKYTSMGINAQIPNFETYVTKYIRSISVVDTTGGPTNGLMAFWSFNGNVRDGSGNGYDGSVTGAVLAKDRFDSTNRSYYFNGNAGTRISTTFPGVVSNNTRTVSFWAKHGSVGNSEHIVTWGDLNTPTKSFSIFFGRSQQNQPMVGVDFGGSYSGAMTNSVSDNQWHHYSITFNDSISVYIDGVYYQPNVSFNLNNINTSLGQNLVIGEYNASGNDWRTFRGYIDEVRIYDRILTPQEIVQLSSN